MHHDKINFVLYCFRLMEPTLQAQFNMVGSKKKNIAQKEGFVKTNLCQLLIGMYLEL